GFPGGALRERAHHVAAALPWARRRRPGRRDRRGARHRLAIRAMSGGLVSVVIPVYNEEATLPALFPRLYGALDALKRPYEIILVDDGSRDRSMELLRAEARRRPDRVKVVELSRNFGQHPAILAGFSIATGEVVVTLDADLQNPPEEIGKLLAKFDEGFDVVGGVR